MLSPYKKKAIRNQQKRKHDYADINTFFVKGKELQYCLQSVILHFCHGSKSHVLAANCVKITKTFWEVCPLSCAEGR